MWNPYRSRSWKIRIHEFWILEGNLKNWKRKNVERKEKSQKRKFIKNKNHKKEENLKNSNQTKNHVNKFKNVLFSKIKEYIKKIKKLNKNSEK